MARSGEHHFKEYLINETHLSNLSNFDHFGGPCGGFPGAVYAQSTGGDEGKFVFGGSYTLDSGDTLYGGLVVVGGSAELEAGSLVSVMW